MAVFGVAWFVDQADGHGLVIVTLVAAVFRQQTRDFLMFPRKVGVLDDELSNALQTVIETCRDVGHLSFGG